jgi:predicted alpha/beta superfamily hydrolase
MTEWRDYPLAGTGQAGEIRLLAAQGVRSEQLRSSRDILVALPPGYGLAALRYPVIYLHDGQNLFDPATSFVGDWGLVETLNALGAEGVKPIVVGIPNRGRRRRFEYSPFRDLLHGGGSGDRYLGFIVETVKPLVDAAFRTRPERAHTVIGGSSLGGLISLYALYRHAGIFGAASVQSPALWFARRAIFRFLERQRSQPVAAETRIHLDVGTEEGAETLADVRRLREFLLNAGYVPGRNLSYLEEAGAGHHEAAWGRRLRAALPFLLGSREVGRRE